MTKISFPALGIDLQINPIAFSIGPFAVHWYALIILAGFAAGFLFIFRDCEKRGLKRDNLWDIALLCMVFGIIGARIYYVLFSLDEFSNIWEMLQIWNGGLAIYGGIIAGVAAILIYCKMRHIPVLNTLDICAPALLVGQAVGRWGNFVNGEVYGRATSLPWGMCVNGGNASHPLFLYESLWNLLGLAALLILRRRQKTAGRISCFYLIWYSTGRFFFEALRIPAYVLYIIPGKLAVSQVIAVLCIIFAVILLIATPLKTPQSPPDDK